LSIYPNLVVLLLFWSFAAQRFISSCPENIFGFLIFLDFKIKKCIFLKKMYFLKKNYLGPNSVMTYRWKTIFLLDDMTGV
jgi:hypothetical protein